MSVSLDKAGPTRRNLPLDLVVGGPDMAWLWSIFPRDDWLQQDRGFDETRCLHVLDVSLRPCRILTIQSIAFSTVTEKLQSSSHAWTLGSRIL
jgi:hypothetical protein